MKNKKLSVVIFSGLLFPFFAFCCESKKTTQRPHWTDNLSKIEIKMSIASAKVLVFAAIDLDEKKRLPEELHKVTGKLFEMAPDEDKKKINKTFEKKNICKFFKMKEILLNKSFFDACDENSPLRNICQTVSSGLKRDAAARYLQNERAEQELILRTLMLESFIGHIIEDGL